MLRRILPGSALAGVMALGIYWWLTAVPSASVLAAADHTPDLANGLTTFNAGGCSSCHAVPGQPDRTKLGGGQVAGSGRRQRGWERGAIRYRGDKGRLARRVSLFPGLSLHLLRTREDRRRPRSLRLPENPCRGLRQGPPSRR